MIDTSVVKMKIAEVEYKKYVPMMSMTMCGNYTRITSVIKILTCIVLFFVVGTLTDIYNLSRPFRRLLPFSDAHAVVAVGPLIVYEKCRGIPDAPSGTRWPEEEYLQDPDVNSILDIADPITSRVWLDGRGAVKLGDTVKLNIQLYNGRNEKRKQGGDLVRVWLKEEILGAKSTAHVIDHKNGSYTAIVTALWEGRPEVQAAIISPREVIATAFKRRYVCPPVLTNTAIFQHPVDTMIVEETPCNYDNHIPGYNDVCDFTQDNYGRPWYCGKPRHVRLVCQDWTMVGDINLWNTGHEQQALSTMEQQLMSLKYTARKIRTNITLSVTKDDAGQRMFIPKQDCNRLKTSVTWDFTSPTGYFYNNMWLNKHCKSNLHQERLYSCLENTTIILIGDSTTRQMFEQIEQLIPCQWMTDTWSKSGKHRPAICTNVRINFSLVWKLHPLPFCTRNTPRYYFKSLQANLNEIHGNKRFVVVIHLYAHFLNYHSHVFYETLKDLKKGVIGLLKRNLNVSIVIKGPHAYSFSKSPDHVVWMPDAYANVYQQLIYKEFEDLKDKVVYLECMDMTVSTEQWVIHADNHIMKSIVENMLSFTCVITIEVHPEPRANGSGDPYGKARHTQDEPEAGSTNICALIFGFIVFILFFPFSLVCSLKIVQEYERAVIFRLGRVLSGGAKGPGLFFLLPCVDDFKCVDLRVISYDIPPQEILTKDSMSVSVDAVIYAHVFDATKSIINVEDAHGSTKLLAATTLRNILGTKSLSEILSDRDSISQHMTSILDEATDPWGIKVERVELKDVRLPYNMQRSMAAEAESAREARAKVIAAEGEMKASRALKEAADVMNDSPGALQLRFLQTMNTVAAQRNETIIFPLPLDLIKKLMNR